jgi:hypothetical protein
LTVSSAALAGPANRTSIAAAGNKEQTCISAIVLETLFMMTLVLRNNAHLDLFPKENFYKASTHQDSEGLKQIPPTEGAKLDPHEFVMLTRERL